MNQIIYSTKRALSLLVTICMVAAIIPSVSVAAAELETVSTVTASPTDMDWNGGTSTITVSGTDLSDGITVTAFDDEGTATNIVGTTTGTDTEQEVTLMFPENSDSTLKTYTIKVSLDGGDDYENSGGWADPQITVMPSGDVLELAVMVAVAEAAASVSTVTASPEDINWSGGASTITVSGTGLSDGIKATAFDDEGISTSITGFTTGTDTEQEVTLVFPANSDSTLKTYIIKVSLDGGDNYENDGSWADPLVTVMSSGDVLEPAAMVAVAAAAANVSTVAASPVNFGWRGGTSTITVSGTGLSDGIKVTAFDAAGARTSITATTTGGGTEQAATLVFPANWLTTEKPYTIKISFDNGTSYEDNLTSTVTVKSSILTSLLPMTVVGTYHNDGTTSIAISGTNIQNYYAVTDPSGIAVSGWHQGSSMGSIMVGGLAPETLYRVIDVSQYADPNNLTSPEIEAGIVSPVLTPGAPLAANKISTTMNTLTISQTNQAYEYALIDMNVGTAVIMGSEEEKILNGEWRSDPSGGAITFRNLTSGVLYKVAVRQKTAEDVRAYRLYSTTPAATLVETVMGSESSPEDISVKISPTSDQFSYGLVDSSGNTSGWTQGANPQMGDLSVSFSGLTAGATYKIAIGAGSDNPVAPPSLIAYGQTFVAPVASIDAMNDITASANSITILNTNTANEYAVLDPITNKIVKSEWKQGTGGAVTIENLAENKTYEAVVRKKPATGELTLYKMPGAKTFTLSDNALYTATCDANGGSGTPPVIEIEDDQFNGGFAVGAAFIVPGDNGLGKTGYAFMGWYDEFSGKTYKEGEIFIMPARDTTLTAKWQDAVTVNGIVKDDSGSGVSGADVCLMSGNEEIAGGTTGLNGSFSFTAIPKGTYNLVVSEEIGEGGIALFAEAQDDEEKKTITRLVTIGDSTGNIEVTMPETNMNSTLDVIGKNAPEIMVGRLDQQFEGSVLTADELVIAEEGGKIEMNFSVESIDMENDAKQALFAVEIGSIKNAMGSGFEVGMLLEFEAEKKVMENDGEDTNVVSVPEMSTPLEIVITFPAELQGMDNYEVYRTHGGSTDQILPTGGTENIEIIKEGETAVGIIIHADKFSAYAIAVADNNDGNNGGNNNSNSGGDSSGDDNSSGNRSGNNNGNNGGNGSNNSGNNGSNTPSSETPQPNAIVNGIAVNAGEVTTSGNTTTMTVNQEVIDSLLEAASGNVTIIIPAGTDTAVAVLVVKNMDDMAAKDMTLTVQVGNILYVIPTNAVDTEAILKALGADNAADVQISITITTNMSAIVQAAVENAVITSGGELVIPPIEFKITATYNGQTVEVDAFSQYISRSVEITEEQAALISTAVVVEADGTIRHVPTRVYSQDGKWYAEISSLTNSTYALVNSKKVFTDANGKWYENIVNEMAGRMIISGVGNDMFAGERDITRAEFAAIVIRALGLPTNGNGGVFGDVSSSLWYAGAVGKAYEYGIVSGVGNGQFAPERKITRQEAMLMMRSAARIAGFNGSTSSIDTFTDAASVSGWALDAARWNVGSELVVGSNGQLRPQDSITRAETATIVLNLLKKAGLVGLR